MKFAISVFFWLGLILSCSSGDGSDAATCIVVRRDFENILTIDGYVEPIRSSTANCPPHTEGTVGFLVEDGTFVKEGDVVCIVEVADLQTSYDQVKSQLENAQVELTKTRANLDMQYALLEAQVRTNEAETQIARLDSLQLQYTPPNQIRIKEMELEQVTIQKNRFEKKLKTLDVIRQVEVRRQELLVQQFTNRLQSFRERLDALTVKAPKDGLAVRARYPLTGNKLQVGDMVWHMMPLVNLPEFSGMKVIIQAPEMDYKYISVNDSVIMSFDAMPGNKAYGKIRMKSPVGQQYRRDSKVKFFEIEASIDSVTTMPDPGYTAGCRILLKQVKDTLIVPQIAVFEEDSIKVVYVRRGKKYDMQQIMTGLSSPKDAIVTSGLQGGEEISLTKPPLSSIRKRLYLQPDSISKDSLTHSTEMI